MVLSGIMRNTIIADRRAAKPREKLFKQAMDKLRLPAARIE